MMNSLLNRHQKRRDESGVAMIIAVLIVLIMVALITLMTSFALRGIEKGNTVQNLNASGNAADTAIANMMTLANSESNRNGSEMDKHLGGSNKVVGSYNANAIDPEAGDGSYQWSWYAEKSTNSSVGTSYEVTATGFQNNEDEIDARTIKVRIESTTVEDINYSSNGQVLYTATLGGSFSNPVFGSQYVDLKDNVKIRKYSSSSALGYPATANSKGDGNPATNNSFKIGSQIDMGNVEFYSSNPSDSEETYINNRCTGVGCEGDAAGDGIVYNVYNYGVSLAQSRKQANNFCPGSDYPDWVASENSGSVAYSTSPKCYNNITFDVDTSLPASWSTGNPAVMYAKGNVTVEKGVEVARQANTSQGPYSFQIIASGTTKFTMERGEPGNPTKMSGTVVGQNLDCNIGETPESSNSQTYFYGSMACNTVTVQPYAEVWWDDQLSKVLKEGSSSSKKIWAAVSYEEN